MTTELPIVKNFGRLAQYGGRCLGCKKWITAQTRKQWCRPRSRHAPTAAGKCGSNGPARRLLYRLFRRAAGRVLDHIRQRVSATRRPPQAGRDAGRVQRLRGRLRQPCIKVSGGIRMYPHDARLRVHADR